MCGIFSTSFPQGPASFHFPLCLTNISPVDACPRILAEAGSLVLLALKLYLMLAPKVLLELAGGASSVIRRNSRGSGLPLMSRGPFADVRVGVTVTPSAAQQAMRARIQLRQRLLWLVLGFSPCGQRKRQRREDTLMLQCCFMRTPGRPHGSFFFPAVQKKPQANSQRQQQKPQLLRKDTPTHKEGYLLCYSRAGP